MDSRGETWARLEKLSLSADLLEHMGRPGCAALIRRCLSAYPAQAMPEERRAQVRAEWLSDVRRIAADARANAPDIAGEGGAPYKRERDVALEGIINLARGLARLFETPENQHQLERIDEAADNAIATLHRKEAVPSESAISTALDDRSADSGSA